MRLSRTGLTLGVGAYALWGMLPLYFNAIAVVGPFEIVPWRVLFTVVICALAMTLLRGWADITRILRSRRMVAWLLLSSLFLYANWQFFVIGVMSDRVLETSMGYFINPLVTILLGVFVRKEVLTRLQWSAVLIAAVGVLVSAINYGRFPWIALGIACSFACYGAVHKELGEAVGGLPGLTIESMMTLPLALIQAVFLSATVGLTAFTHGASIGFLVILSGVITAVPLIFFGEAAARLPLTVLGFLQFLTPIITFLYGYLVLSEPMDASRWIGFIAVWIAVSLLIFDLVRRSRNDPRGESVGLRTEPIALD